MASYRILALDGGGIRGLLTTILLERLCRRPGLAQALEGVDLIAGNSSGALVALAMADGLKQPTMVETLAVIRQVFERGRETFGPRLPWWLGGWWLFSKYGTKAREDGLKRLLGPDKTLGQLNRHVLIPAFDLDNDPDDPGRVKAARTWKPKLFHNFEGANSDRDTLAWKVGLYSSAAPAYFPTVDGYSDGGAYANNPSMCALAQVYDYRYPPNPKPPLDEVVLLSVGAGQNLKFIHPSVSRWGIVPWAWWYVPLTMDSTVGVADYECRQMLRDRNYRRLAPAFPAGVEIQLDDFKFKTIEYLSKFADRPDVSDELERCADWMRKYWMPRPAALPIVPEITSKHVGPATELTCLMPIKPGFLPQLETRTYATRLRIVFKALQRLRVASREERTLKPIVDIVEAARTVHAFSWAIIQDRLLLNVSFDRPWEPYIRVIWKDLGPLLDLFLCNCEGFVPSTDSFERFAAFVRQHQVDAAFYYPSSSVTVDDQRYLVEFEKRQREESRDFESTAATLVADGPETLARKDARHSAEAVKQWLTVLKVLYGLRDLYPEESPDHVFLHRAARSLLERSRPPLLPHDSPELAWFDGKPYESHPPRDGRAVDRSNVQGGILKAYGGVSHGCMLLASIEDAAGARRFIGKILSDITPEQRNKRLDDISMNVAFTFGGLGRLGVRKSDLARLPKEFREGMEARAGLLGDVRENHPENWTLPEWNVRFNGTGTVTFTGSLAERTLSAPAPMTASDFFESGYCASAHDDSDLVEMAPPVRMSAVDVVIVLHKAGAEDAPHDWTSDHPLYRRVEDLSLEAKERGIRVLSVQPLRRYSRDYKPNQTSPLSADHFGFLDGISQPTAVADPKKPDEVELGEVFVGFRNQRGDPPFPETSADPAAWVRGSLVDSGSFLVVRKLQQNVGVLREIVDRAKKEGLTPEDLYAKMVGRSRAGVPLVAGAREPINNFDFGRDEGKLCPFHAHIRRGNPRLQKTSDGAAPPRVPRIVRRALAYGPPFAEKTRDTDRGMMFMAYNASIAEQFEIIQRWMSGGNPPGQDGNTSVFSGQPDCLLGLPDGDGKRRTYRFLHNDTPHQVDLGDKPFVTLQWGLYLFVPSIAGLEELTKNPSADLATANGVVAFGSQVIKNLKTQDDWAAALEDISATQSGVTDAVYAAISATHGGAIRTPYGVLVTTKALAMEVLHGDPVFSVREYQSRFGHSVGEGYLGMDRGEEYEKLSHGPNEALNEVTKERACTEAYAVATSVLGEAVKAATPKNADGSAQIPTEPLQIPLEPVVDRVIAELARRWFDIPDDDLIKVGGRPAAGDETLHCPFHFVAPSRYIFSSPNPRGTVTALGENHGQRLLEKVKKFVEQRREEQRTGIQKLKGPVSRKLFETIRGDDDRLASTLLGLAFGFAPTVYGNALKVLGLWLGDETLWRLQQRFLDSRGGTLYDRALSVLEEPLQLAMQTRPLPPLLYRMVTARTRLGGIDLEIGDRVVIGMSGVTQESLSRGASDVTTVFGGDRRKENHPTHACPGYHIAMAALLGLLAGILNAGTLKPSPALVTVRVTPREALAAV